MMINENLPDQLEDKISDFLLRAAKILDPFSIEEVGGYGVTVDIVADDTARVSMHRFCWCDGFDCPWCAYHEEDLEDISEEARATLADAGHVPGHAAPNFRFKAADFEARIWWYKYIGRGMSADLDEARLAELEHRFDDWASQSCLEIAQASLASWLSSGTTHLDADTLGALRKAFLSRLAACKTSEERAAETAEIRDAIAALCRQGRKARQCDDMEGLLDKAGVQREDPEFPEEIFGSMTPAYRLERVLFHEGKFPAPSEDEMPEPAPREEQGVGDEIPF